MVVNQVTSVALVRSGKTARTMRRPVDNNDECLICSQFGPEYAHIRDVEWDRNRRLIGHLPSLLPGSGHVRGMMAPAGPLGKATLSRDTHQTAPPLTLLVKLAVYPGRGKANAREER